MLTMLGRCHTGSIQSFDLGLNAAALGALICALRQVAACWAPAHRGLRRALLHLGEGAGGG
jgi:hypothetical protein